MLSIENLRGLPEDAGHAMKTLISNALIEWHQHLDEKARIQHYNVYQTAFDRVKHYCNGDKKDIPLLGKEKSNNIMAIIQFFTDIQKRCGQAENEVKTSGEIRQYY